MLVSLLNQLPCLLLECMTILFHSFQTLLLSTLVVNSRHYRYSPLHKFEIERQVQELLAAGLITQSTSPFASPVLLVKKKMAIGDSA
jgi:hypothetical protein